MKTETEDWSGTAEAELVRTLLQYQANLAKVEHEIVTVHAEMLLRLLRSQEVRYLEVSLGATGDDGAELLVVANLLNAQGEICSPSPRLRHFYYPSDWRSQPLSSLVVSLGEHAVSRALAHLLGPATPTGYDNGVYVGEGGNERGYYDLWEYQGLTATQYAERVASLEVALPL